MRKRIGIVTAAIVAATLWTGGFHGALAQDATPVFPDPSECVVEPRTVDDIVDLTLNGDYMPDADIAAGKLPTGDPAPADAVEGIDSTLRQLTACSNNNDIPRMLSLTTDHGAQYWLDFESSVTEEQLRAMAAAPVSPVPEAEREAFVPIANPVLLSDGRIGGVINTSNEGDVVYGVFKEIDGVWLVDEIIGIPAPAPREAAAAA